eukprot:GILI01002761.1.p1 GENE.GILI01002761.1~~GILI01002761.1.p1  ORF type:complete len:502 (+),score=105.46 GILI01002761.1:128-1507(+)
MVSDFFYPNLGGVEMHLYQLSQCLLQRKHKVIVVTHAYGKRTGVRYLTNGLKVYYVPQLSFVDNCSWPTLVGFFPVFRNILIRERISIVHGHQATSVMALEAMLTSKTMGYKVIYTDHSLFGFADAACIHINKVLKWALSEIDHAICVSHTSKENLVLRASLSPHNVSVIPNAVDATRFTPDPSARRPSNTINIVVLSRLTYRKGVDLLIDVVPEICRRFSQVHFIIGGDGPKRLLLEEMREKHHLHDRVELLGAVPHKEVRNVLVRGHIFLNCSLTEAFCIAIVEAASCGLMVVSTKVGGVPEVLPRHMIKLAEPDAADIVEVLSDTVPLVKNVVPQTFHQQIKEMYNWHNVAARTEKVYDKVARSPSLPLLDRFKRYYGCGPVAGKVFCILFVIFYLVWRLVDFLSPADEIDVAPDFPQEKYSQIKEKLKDPPFVPPTFVKPGESKSQPAAPAKKAS